MGSMLRLFSLIAIAFLQFVYFRYFFLLALLSTVCSIGYCLFCLRFFARKIKQNFICLFALLSLRIFDILSVLSIFGGIATCKFYYKMVVLPSQIGKYEHELLTIQIAMWFFIICAVMLCCFESLYV